MQSLNKQLKIRVRALPNIKNKESALRMEVKKAKDKVHSLDDELKTEILKYDGMRSLWNEFEPDLLSVDGVDLEVKKIAGVKTPVLMQIRFGVKQFSLFEAPVWYYDGINILKNIVDIAIAKQIFLVKMELLEKARRKTTQKVNLYEKVQIPGFQEALLKIKRFLEDEENLSKSSQKIVKTRQLLEEAS
jgi:V/A-type H+-transporting ATPase subunit D